MPSSQSSTSPSTSSNSGIEGLPRAIESGGTDATEIAVLGRGAWGSTLANLAKAKAGSLRQWSRRDGSAISEVIRDSNIVISAISMRGVPSTIAQVRAVGLPADAIIVSATKGLDAGSLKTPAQLWQAAFPELAVVVLSGPNLSKEIDRGLPAATVVSSTSIGAAEVVQQALASERFRVYTNDDPIGTELGGTLKNIVAIAAGVCDGLQLGANAKSALIARGLAEMVRIGVQLGAQAETFSGLSGLGDLLATCSGMLSRNYQVGFHLARGRSLVDILDSLEGTAEGVNTTPVMLEIASREGLTLPITHQVNRLLNGEIAPVEAVTALMDRTLKPERRD